MKNDIKYIIKRIIIGVGIAFGVMLVKSLPVFAEETQNYYINYDEDFFKTSSYVFSLKTSQANNTSIVDSFTLYDKYKINLTMDNNFNYYGYYYLLYNETTNEYYMQYFASKEKLDFNYTYGLFYGYSSADKPYELYRGNFEIYYNSDFKNIENSLNLDNYTYETDYGNLGIDKLGKSLYRGYKFTNNDNNLTMDYNRINIYENEWKIISTNIKSNIYKQSDGKVSKFYEYRTIPTGYEKIDMKDKYAVVFYPKDVRNLEKKCTKTEEVYETDKEGNVSVVKKCVEESYLTTFWHNGNFNILNSDIQNMNYVEHPVTSNAMNELFEETLFFEVNEFKNAIIFYNNAQNQNTDEEGNVTVIDYGGNGLIYYDPNLFNYFFIEKPDSEVNEDISFIDKDGNEQNVHVDTVPKQDAYADFNLGFDEETINKFDVVSAFKSFINMISDGASFFKKYISLFLKNVPDFVYYFIIFIPILSIIIAVLKIVNNR